MLKASALYMVIVIALVIGVLCSSLIVVAYFYRAEYQKKFRYVRLQNNLESGINILLTSADTSYSRQTALSLFQTDADSLILKKIRWGIYDVGTVEATVQRDTLFKVFTIASAIDSGKWAALYLADENRPVSVSGNSVIIGDAYIPKAGIQSAYIDGRAYTGDKRIIIGKKLTSGKTLPSLDTARLRSLYTYFSAQGVQLNAPDSVSASFLHPTKIYNLGSQAYTLSKIKLKGNIVLRSDTTLTIDSTASLNNVLIFARVIIVKSGFKGNCQLFATDSISVGQDCKFTYPSCLGIVRFVAPKIASQSKVTIDQNTTIKGLIFTYEKSPNDLKPLISIGKRDTIKGQVYSQNGLNLKDSCEIDGSIFTYRFLYKNAFTLYENYLINVKIDSKGLSPYYLSSSVFPAITKKKRILQWLEGN